MKFYCYIFLFLISLTTLNAYALEVLTQVSDIEVSEKIYEPSLVFLASGQVAKVSPGDNELLQLRQSAKQELSLLKITLTSEREITHVEFIEC